MTRRSLPSEIASAYRRNDNFLVLKYIHVYSSPGLESEPYVMGKSTQEMRSLFQLVGLQNPWIGELPDDHIALELDVCMHLHRALEIKPAPEFVQVYEYLLVHHMQDWVPSFVQRFSLDPNCPKLFFWLGEQLQLHITLECEWVRQFQVPQTASLILSDNEVPHEK